MAQSSTCAVGIEHTKGNGEKTLSAAISDPSMAQRTYATMGKFSPPHFLNPGVGDPRSLMPQSTCAVAVGKCPFQLVNPGAVGTTLTMPTSSPAVLVNIYTHIFSQLPRVVGPRSMIPLVKYAVLAIIKLKNNQQNADPMETAIQRIMHQLSFRSWPDKGYLSKRFKYNYKG